MSAREREDTNRASFSDSITSMGYPKECEKIGWGVTRVFKGADIYVSWRVAFGCERRAKEIRPKITRFCGIYYGLLNYSGGWSRVGFLYTKMHLWPLRNQTRSVRQSNHSRRTSGHLIVLYASSGKSSPVSGTPQGQWSYLVAESHSPGNSAISGFLWCFFREDAFQAKTHLALDTVTARPRLFYSEGLSQHYSWLTTQKVAVSASTAEGCACLETLPLNCCSR